MNRLVVILLISQILISCGKKEKGITPAVQSITESVYASGAVRGENQYQAFARVSGTIETIMVKEGDLVKIGDPILKIANSAAAFNKENSAATADFNAPANNRDKLQDIANTLEVARQKMVNDSLLYLRQQNLWQQNVGTRIELEQRQLNWENSRNNFLAANIRYEQQKRQLKYAGTQAKLNYEMVNAQLNDLYVRSEINGRVYDVFKKKGEMVNAQTPVALVASSNAFYIELQVDEVDIARVKTGQQIFITMDSYKGEVFQAKVTTVHPLMNEKTKTFLIEALFTKAPAVLYPNLSCEGNIVISKKENALLIPRAYLTDANQVKLENGEMRDVKTGLMDYSMVEIISGLSREELIIKPN